MRFPLALALSLLALPAAAQTVVERMTCGAVSGIVTDDFGDPLPGASVMLEGTQIRTSTDIDGAYRLDCVPAGVYQVSASFVGFAIATSAEVMVPALYHREVRFTLAEGWHLECGTIDYRPPLISRDPYSSRTLSGDEIERLPVGR